MALMIEGYQLMTALLLGPDGDAELRRADLTAGMSEKWLQDILFRHPALIPLDQIEPGAGVMIPLCREFPLPKLGRNVFIDLLGITTTGKLVIVECKLWRNPQARREVVAQIIEYAALLRHWSYSDLTARLTSLRGWTGTNPLHDHVLRAGASLDEAVFTDAVQRALRRGDFYLIIAGDGIREDLSTIAEHLDQQGSRLALVEFQHWANDQGRSLLVPSIPFRSEVVRQRILTDLAGEPLRLAESEAQEDDAAIEAIDPDRSEKRAENRVFWQKFIDTVRFDHPDQTSPRHGGDNWVRVPMPSPARWLTLYRLRNGTGASLVEIEGSGLLKKLSEDMEGLRRETGLSSLNFIRNAVAGPGQLVISASSAEVPTPDKQMDWLKDVSNRLVTVLRQRIAEVGEE